MTNPFYGTQHKKQQHAASSSSSKYSYSAVAAHQQTTQFDEGRGNSSRDHNRDQNVNGIIVAKQQYPSYMLQKNRNPFYQIQQQPQLHILNNNDNNHNHNHNSSHTMHIDVDGNDDNHSRKSSKPKAPPPGCATTTTTTTTTLNRKNTDDGDDDSGCECEYEMEGGINKIKTVSSFMSSAATIKIKQYVAENLCCICVSMCILLIHIMIAYLALSHIFSVRSKIYNNVDNFQSKKDKGFVLPWIGSRRGTLMENNNMHGFMTAN